MQQFNQPSAHSPHCPGRRDFFKLFGALTAAASLPIGKASAAASSIFSLRGEVLVNRRAAEPSMILQTGDRIETGLGSVSFVLGTAAYFLRQNTAITLMRGRSINQIGVADIEKGGVGGVMQTGDYREVNTPHMTAGMETGAGFYVEVTEQGSNFCACFGQFKLRAGYDKTTATSNYHQQYFAKALRSVGVPTLLRSVSPNHTDNEMDVIAAQAGQKTFWQEMSPVQLAQEQARRTDEFRTAFSGGVTSPDAGAANPRVNQLENEVQRLREQLRASQRS